MRLNHKSKICLITFWKAPISSFFLSYLGKRNAGIINVTTVKSYSLEVLPKALENIFSFSINAGIKSNKYIETKSYANCKRGRKFQFNRKKGGKICYMRSDLFHCSYFWGGEMARQWDSKRGNFNKIIENFAKE